MGQVMKLANGSVETILNERDFEDILDKYLGTEAADYFHNLFSDYEEAKAVQDKVEELQFDLEHQKEEYKNLEEEYEEYRLENPRHHY